MRRAALAGAAMLLLVGCSSEIEGSAALTSGGPATTSVSPTSAPPTGSTTSRTSESSSSSSSSSPTTTDAEPWSAERTAFGYPTGLRDVSPNGQMYAVVVDDKLCLGDWSGAAPKCLIDTTASDGVLADFSGDGTYLGALLFKGGVASTWVVDVPTGEARILGVDGLTSDVASGLALAAVTETWAAGNRFLMVQLAPGAGSSTGELVTVPVDGSIPTSGQVPAEVADGNPQMIMSDQGDLVLAPTTGSAASELFVFDYAGSQQTNQVGTVGYSPGGAVILVAVAPDGSEALICPTQGDQIGELQRVDLTTGAVADFGQDDVCDEATYSPDGKYVAVAGPAGDNTTLALAVFDRSSGEVMVRAGIEGSAQNTPARMTWSADDVLTIVPADGTDPSAKVNVLQLTRS